MGLYTQLTAQEYVISGRLDHLSVESKYPVYLPGLHARLYRPQVLSSTTATAMECNSFNRGAGVGRKGNALIKGTITRVFFSLYSPALADRSGRSGVYEAIRAARSAAGRTRIARTLFPNWLQGRSLFHFPRKRFFPLFFFFFASFFFLSLSPLAVFLHRSQTEHSLDLVIVALTFQMCFYNIYSCGA